MLYLAKKEKERVFATDIAKIQSEDIRAFVVDVLGTLPWYFWVQPASTTGKYHPVCTLCRGGLLAHTKRVIFFGEKLIRAHGWSISSNKADRIIAAMILHDGQKGGAGYGPYEDYEDHPLLVEQRSGRGERIGKEEWEVDIWQMIRYHMGPWSPEPAYKPLEQYTESELIVYHADYLAAQKDLVTPVDNTIADMKLVYSACFSFGTLVPPNISLCGSTNLSSSSEDEKPDGPNDPRLPEQNEEGDK